MKKIIFNLLVILAMAAGTAMAGVAIPSAGTSIGSQAFKMSNKVQIFVSSVAGDSTNPGGFSAASFHDSGNRNFSVNSVEPKIYWQDKGTTPLAATDVVFTDATSYTPAITGWNSL